MRTSPEKGWQTVQNCGRSLEVARLCISFEKRDVQSWDKNAIKEIKATVWNKTRHELFLI